MKTFVWFSFLLFCLLDKDVHCVDKNAVENDPPIISEEEGACTDPFEPYPGDCTKFYMCDHGKRVAMNCPPGTHWNNNARICDWPQNANCDTNKPPVTPPPPPPPPPVDPPNNNGEYKVICYFPNWAFYRPDGGKYVPEMIDGNLCTHIIYAFAVLDPNTLTIKTHDSWADIDNKFYEKVTAYRQKGIKVLIAIGGWNDSLGDKYGRLLLDGNARQNFIANVIQFIQQYGFDGLDLDLEYPSCWQNNCESSRSNEKEAFAQFASELSNAFKPKGLLLSAAVSASQRVIDAAYDVPKLSQSLDWISLMTYDYHGQWDGKTGHNAPLKSTDPSDHFTTDFTTRYWIQAGAPTKKLILGVPSYGQSFTLANAQNNGFNAPSSGPGEAGTFTRAAGMLSYYEICDKTKKNGWTVVRDPQNLVGPYAFSGNQWVSFDDVENIRTKAKLVRELGLGGGMMWSLDFDDFTGNCGCGKYPLLTALNQELRNIGGNAVNNCT